MGILGKSELHRPFIFEVHSIQFSKERKTAGNKVSPSLLCGGPTGGDTVGEDCVGHIRSGQVTVGLFSELQVRVSPTCLSYNNIYAFSYPRKSRVLHIFKKGMYISKRLPSKIVL